MSTDSRTAGSRSISACFTGLATLSVLGGALLASALHAEEGTPSTRGVAAFYAALAGSSWELRGEWEGGGAFHQIKEVDWGLDGRIVKVRTFAPDPSGEGFVLRSEGIRAPDRTVGGWRFFEFDRDGGIVYGPIGRTESSLYYEYEYFVGGELRTLRDAWVRTGEAGLVYQIGIWEDDDWEKILLTAEARPIAPDVSPFSEQPGGEPPATDPQPGDAADASESATTEEPDGDVEER